MFHFWARFWPYFNFVDFQAYFGHFSLVKRADINAEKTAEGGLKSINAKQTHSKIQFHIGICVTTVKKNILLYSTRPNGQNHQIIEKSLDFKLAREFVIVFIHRQNKSMAKIAPKSDKFMKYLNYKSSLRILIGPLEVPFFVVRKRSLLPEVPTFETKKLALPGAKSKF